MNVTVPAHAPAQYLPAARGLLVVTIDSRWSAFLMPEPLLDWLASKRMLTAPTLAFYAHTSEEAAGYRIIEYQKSR